LGSTCNGDSGGPLFISLNGMWSLAGVTSGGRLDCIPSQKSKDESYDVDVSKYISWIRANANVVSASSSDKFIVDKSNRAFGSVYHLFVVQADKLDADVFIPAGLPALNFAVNATPTYSSLQIELIPPGSNLAACTNKSPDAYVTCSIDAPMQGTWRLSVSGSKPQETQVIGNVVR
jgi:Trypsin